jgi:hypothetical protein
MAAQAILAECADDTVACAQVHAMLAIAHEIAALRMTR